MSEFFFAARKFRESAHLQNISYFAEIWFRELDLDEIFRVNLIPRITRTD